MKKIISFLFIIYNVVGFTQEESTIKPDKAFENENYALAIKGYEKELIAQPQDYNTLLQLGKCYINSYIDREKAIYYLEKIKGAKNNDFEALFYLGRAYHLNYKFDWAINTFQTFIDSTQDSTVAKIALRQIEMCKNAKELVVHPVEVTLKNLGDTINSKAPDYFPFIDQTESILVFSSKRKKRNKAEAPSPSGFYTADVFMSYFENGAWQKLKSQSKVCTPSNEEIVGLSADGKLMFLNVTGRGVTGEMVVSSRKTGSFKEPVRVEKTVNTKAIELTASVTQDRQKFYYGSNREGGYGGFDIYEAKRLPTLNWGMSKSLGETINTPYNELFPQLSPDEKTLYFASEGHNSMGGYDLFKSEWDEEKQQWGKPINLGYPINTPDDDMHFAVNADGSAGYIATYRKDSKGDLDIYSVHYNNIESKKTVITGKIYTYATIDYSGVPNSVNKSKTTTKVPVKETMIDVYTKTGDLYGSYTSNSNTGNFVMILPPGKYSVVIMADGYNELETQFEVLGKGSFVSFTEKNFDVEPLGAPITIPYNDISK